MSRGSALHSKSTLVTAPTPGARRLVAVAALLSASCAAGCCPDPPSVDLQPSWKAGDTARYDWNKSIRRRRAGVTVAEHDRHKLVELEVVSADANGHIFRIRRTAKPLDEPAQPVAEPADNESFDEADGIDVLIELDRQGHLWRITNYGDVRRQILERRAALQKKAELRAPGDGKSTSESKTPPAPSLDRSQFEQALFGDASPWLNALGRKYTFAESITIERRVADSFGVEPCPVHDCYTLESVANESAGNEMGSAVLYFYRTNDPQVLTPDALKIAQDRAAQEGRTVPNESSPRTLFASGTVEIEPATGLLRNLSLKTSTTTGDQVAEEILEIKRIP